SSEVATKVSEADFSTYQTQTASEFANTVSEASFATYQTQTASSFASVVSNTSIANSNATAAKSTASLAVTSATAAQSSASSALNSATAAYGNASSAVTTASGADSNATVALSSASVALSSAKAASSSAAIASTAASNAMSNANAASSAATVAQQTATEITDFVTDGNGNIGTSFLTALEKTSLMTGWDGSSSIFNQTSSQINLAVNAIQIGGTNLLQNTSSSLQSTTVTTSTGWGDINRYQDIPITVGQTYTFRVWLQCSTKNVLAHVKWLNSSKSEISEINGNTIALGDTGGYSKVTGTAPANAVYARAETIHFPGNDGAAGDVVSYKEEKFETGNMPTAWSAAPEDLTNNSQLLAEINIQSGTTLIQNDKLYLNASSIVFGGTAFINDAMVTDLSASKLTAGTIDASKITVINLDANNISANASAFFKTQWQSNYGQYLSITASEIDFITSSNTAKINSSGFTVYQGSGQFGFNVTKWGDSSGGTTSSYGTYMGTYTSNGFLAFTGNGIGSTLVWMDSGMSKGSQVGELG
ncbi:peptidase, partial [Oenococcus oeni]